MDKSPRSLRRLPARSAKSAERSFAKARLAREADVLTTEAAYPTFSKRPQREIERKEIKKASPPRRRSRSRSNARKKAEAVKNMQQVDVKKETVVIEKYATRSTTRVATPPVGKIVSRLKEGIEHVRNSVSPEVDEVVRRSLSRFEELKTEVVNNIVTRRASARSSRASSVAATINSVAVDPSEASLEDEVNEESNAVFKNHIGAKTKEKSPVTHDGSKKKLIANLKGLGIFLFGIAICALVAASHVLCSKDDCRLLLSNLPKALDYTQYFDSYIWPTYSLSAFLLYVGCYFVSIKQRKPQIFSIVGTVTALLLLASLWGCHHYFGDLRRLKIMPLIAASIVHLLGLIAITGTSRTLGSVPQENLIQLLSSIVMVVLNACLSATEIKRGTPILAVHILNCLQAFVALDHLILPPLNLGLGPIGLLWLSLRPFLFVLSQTYLSANSIALGTYEIIGIVSLHAIGYILFRYSTTIKLNFLRDPYSAIHNKTSLCGDYCAGPWSFIRHPQMLGLLLCELSWALSTLLSPVAAVLVPLSVISMKLLSQSADRRLSRMYRSRVTSSLVPFVPY